MKNNIKVLFFFFTILSTMFLISSYSWLNMWIWLEINLMMFISFIININYKLSIESSLIYFLIQTIASILLIFSIIMIQFIDKMYFLMIFSLMLKIGSAPFHYWLPLIINNLNWMKILLLLTWQKINPLIILFYIFNMKLFNLFIILSLIFSTLSSLNYFSLKKIMAFSSINQLSWIIISINFNKLMNIYILFYFYLMFLILKLMKFLNLNNINQIYNLNLNNKFLKIFLFFNIISLAGLPPFLGFFPKMFIIMKMNNYLMIFLMLMFSLFMLFIYLRMIYSMILLNSLKMNLFMKNNFKKMKYFLFNSIINNLMILLLFFIY